MRIQIMSLPAVLVDDRLKEPFAIVVDQCPAEAVSEFFAAQVNDFAKDCGSKAALITSETVEVVDQYADDEPVTDEAIERFADAVAGRLASHHEGWYPEPPKVDIGEMRIHMPEDLDAEQVTRRFRVAMGACPDCGKRSCVCTPPAVRDLSEAIKDAHDMLKQVVKDYGLSNNLLVVADEQEQG
jgi:hypothetical protein